MKNGFLLLYALSFPFFSFAGRSPAPPAVPYMDQVVQRKKEVIAKKCLQYVSAKEKGFMMVEVKVSPKGEVVARLLSTELKSQNFLNCTLSILNRTHLKAFTKIPVIRIYRFFVL